VFFHRNAGRFVPNKGGKIILVFPIIDGHRAAEQVDDADVGQFELAHLFRHGQLRGIMFEGFQNVGVGRGVAAKQPTHQRHGHLQVREIQAAPEGVRRLAKIQHDEPRAGLGDPEHFVQAAFPAREVPQSVADGDNVEGIVGKRKLLRVALDEFQIRDLRFQMALRGDFEHLGAEIKAGGFRAALRKGKRDVAGAAAEVERAVAGLDLRQLDDAAFPEPVQAEALQVVQKIVAAGDAGEEVVDFRGALFAGRVIGVAHADSLAATGARGKAEKCLCA